MVKLILKSKFILAEEDLETIRLKVQKDFEQGVAVIPSGFEVIVINEQEEPIY